MIVRFFFLTYDSNFFVRTDRARICYVKDVLKMLLKKRAIAQLEIYELVEGLRYTTNLNGYLHGFVSLHCYFLI